MRNSLSATLGTAQPLSDTKPLSEAKQSTPSLYKLQSAPSFEIDSNPDFFQGPVLIEEWGAKIPRTKSPQTPSVVNNEPPLCSNTEEALIHSSQKSSPYALLYNVIRFLSNYLKNIPVSLVKIIKTLVAKFPRLLTDGKSSKP